MSTWLDDIQIALRNLGGEAHLSKIFEEVKKIEKNYLQRGQEQFKKN